MALGLHGIARNLADGRVEVIVDGNTAAIETLGQWLRHGPPTAEVESVQRMPWPEEVPAGFSTA